MAGKGVTMMTGGKKPKYGARKIKGDPTAEPIKVTPKDKSLDLSFTDQSKKALRDGLEKLPKPGANTSVA